ncbi:MAG: hypothetical protein ONB23_01290 [candidate division KSB1 bacterium]|nr:hypothetical protein [candidate division KSB1 bacterium]
MNVQSLMAVGVMVFQLGLSVSPAQTEQVRESSSSCEWCHAQLGDRLAQVVQAFRNDAHRRHGFGCATCHGGDPTLGWDGLASAAMDPRKGYIGVPKGKEVVRLCARCHSSIEYMRGEKPGLPTDQEKLYYTSVHGKRLLAGDLRVAICSSCHRAHGILPAGDPGSSVYPANVASTCGSCHGSKEYMAAYNIPTDQVEEWSGSVHGEALLKKHDLGAPTCNDCHGNHGAVPPGVTHISRVCGQCHPAEDEYFQKSPHRAAYERLGVPQCEVCHGNHGVQAPSEKMIGVSEGAVCAACHGSGSVGYTAALRIREGLDSLRTLTDQLDTLADRAQRAGAYVENVRFRLQEAKTSLKKARSLVHTFDPVQVLAETKVGLGSAHKAADELSALNRELRRRRIGLTGFLILIVAGITLLLVEIRRLDRGKGPR